jgi:hypothetical protein
MRERFGRRVGLNPAALLIEPSEQFVDRIDIVGQDHQFLGGGPPPARG